MVPRETVAVWSCCSAVFRQGSDAPTLRRMLLRVYTWASEADSRDHHLSRTAFRFGWGFAVIASSCMDAKHHEGKQRGRNRYLGSVGDELTHGTERLLDFSCLVLLPSDPVPGCGVDRWEMLILCLAIYISMCVRPLTQGRNPRGEWSRARRETYVSH